MFFKKSRKYKQNEDEGFKFHPCEEDKYKWLEEYDIRYFLDVGAHQGESIEKFKAVFPNANYYCFEPVESNISILEERYSRDKNIHICGFGLGDKTYNGQINVNEFTPSSSILDVAKAHTDAFPFTSKTKSEQITIKRFDEFWCSHDNYGEIIAKIDTQGYELSVLRGFGGYLRQVRILIIETSFEQLYDGQPEFHEVYNYVVQHGYKYIGSYDQLSDPRNGRVLQQDAVFERV